MKKITTYAVAILLMAFQMNAQTGTSINANGASPDPSAMLDVSSTSKGVLIPRMTETEKESVVSPAAGLMVFQSDGNTGFWYYNGAAWVKAGDDLGNHTAENALDMSNNKVTNVALCTNNLDAANKEYVDNAVGAGGGPTVPDTTYTLSGTKLLPVAYGGTSYTVPAGKMWAIESAIYTSFVYPVRITAINGLTYGTAYIGNYSYSGNNIYCIATPYVLPAGTTVSFDVGSGITHRGLVSVREYKIAVQ